MEPKIVTKPAFNIVGMKYRGKNEHNEIPQLWGQFVAQIPSIKHQLPQPGSYGAMDNFDEEGGEFDYLAARAVERIADVPEGLLGWEIPENTYAVFTCTLPTLQKTFGYAYHTWLPQSGYERACGAEFEFYDRNFDPNDESSTMFIYIPIKK